MQLYDRLYVRSDGGKGDLLACGRETWWGEAPEQLYDFDEGAGLLSLNIRLHQYVRRAAVYRVNTVKRFVRPIHATISGAEPTQERRGRPTARPRIALA